MVLKKLFLHRKKLKKKFGKNVFSNKICKLLRKFEQKSLNNQIWVNFRLFSVNRFFKLKSQFKADFPVFTIFLSILPKKLILKKLHAFFRKSFLRVSYFLKKVRFYFLIADVFFAFILWIFYYRKNVCFRCFLVYVSCRK